MDEDCPVVLYAAQLSLRPLSTDYGWRVAAAPPRNAVGVSLSWATAAANVATFAKVTGRHHGDRRRSPVRRPPWPRVAGPPGPSAGVSRFR